MRQFRRDNCDSWWFYDDPATKSVAVPIYQMVAVLVSQRRPCRRLVHLELRDLDTAASRIRRMPYLNNALQNSKAAWAPLSVA